MEPFAAGQTGEVVVEVEGVVGVIAGAGVVVKVLPDCVTVITGLLCRKGVSEQKILIIFRWKWAYLDVLDLCLVAKPAPRPAPIAAARHRIAITASARKALFWLILETGWISSSTWINKILFESLAVVQYLFSSG